MLLKFVRNMNKFMVDNYPGTFWIHNRAKTIKVCPNIIHFRTWITKNKNSFKLFYSAWKFLLFLSNAWRAGKSRVEIEQIFIFSLTCAANLRTNLKTNLPKRVRRRDAREWVSVIATIMKSQPVSGWQENRSVIVTPKN